LSAHFGSHNLVRFSQEPQRLRPQERLAILVIRFPAGKEVPIEKVGLDGLRQQIQDFETRYSLKTSEFYARFLRGEMGDKRNFIVWAGLHELLQRIMA
jgi:hypothetical protein